MPVADQTRVEGLHVLDVWFSKPGVDSEYLTVFDAMKSLGLRPEKGQIPDESIVVDHANFTPTGN